MKTMGKTMLRRNVTSLFALVTLSALLQTGSQAQITTNNPTEAASRWPIQIDTPDGQLTIYQPQPTKFEGDQLSGRAAVSLLKAGSNDPVFGAIWMTSRVDTDRVARTVSILDTQVTRVKFPEGITITPESLTSELGTVLPAHQMGLSLDQLLAMVEEVQHEQQSTAQITNAPPKIIFQTHPTVVLQYDGDPRFSQATNSPLQRAENTPFFVVEDTASNTYFLKGAGRWFSARNPMGPFQMTGSVPEAVSSLADSSGYQDPEQPVTDQQANQLEILAATDPTEVIWSDGAIQMGTIPNTNLLYVMNTDSDVFREIDSQAWFILLSGRWYSAASENGPWTPVDSDKLPDDFRRIPPASAKARVLASIAGTQQAQDAVADTFVPQTAMIDRHDFQQPTVTYDGQPNFQPIEGTQMQYAANTPESVIQSGGQYYCCYNGAWYNSASATGGWGLCTAVPAEIYTIPPSCPLYPCRFCYVYGVTPEYCYVGYTPGYVGCYRWHHVVVYGTGWRYRPWIGNHFYPRPFTFGFGAHYDPYTGFWGFDIGLHADHGYYWVGALPRPGFERGPFFRTAWFGHGGFRPPIMHRDIYLHHDILEHPELRPAGWNIYASRHDVHGEIGRPNPRSTPGEIHSEDRRVDIRPEPTLRTGINARESLPHQDIYADPNGNIFRRTEAGSWEQHNDHGWQSFHETPESHDLSRSEPTHTEPAHTEPGPVESDRSEPVRSEPSRVESRPQESPHFEEPALNRDFQARQFGEQRSADFGRSESVHSAPAPEPHFSGGGGGGGGGGNVGGGSGGGGGGMQNHR
ncbi:MAG TPA: hypothetical protein VGG19_01040 [Tepidisphaeraceae bacterium]|jgi:hypothetical protein